MQVVWTMQVQVRHGGYAGELKLYGTAQRQLDTRMHATARKFLGEDYAMHSIFERATVMFVPASGKLSGMCTCKCCTHFWINLLILIVYTQWIYKYCLCMFQLILELIVLLKNCSRVVACSISHSVLFGVLLFGLENEFFISDWISINLFMFGLSVG